MCAKKPKLLILMLSFSSVSLFYRSVCILAKQRGAKNKREEFVHSNNCSGPPAGFQFEKVALHFCAQYKIHLCSPGDLYSIENDAHTSFNWNGTWKLLYWLLITRNCALKVRILSSLNFRNRFAFTNRIEYVKLKIGSMRERKRK